MGTKFLFIIILIVLTSLQFCPTMCTGRPTYSDPPVADFFAVPTSGWDLYYRPEFIGLSTGEITDVLWDFGDGSTSADLAPNHRYDQPGVYTITLIVNGPSGADTLRKENYITVKDFADYPYPTYNINEPTQALWDSVMNEIQASQLEGPDPGDPVWWDEGDVGMIKHGGGGRILFGFSDDTIFVNDRRDFFGDHLIVDGEDKNVHFFYNGPDACDQTEGQDALLRIHGNGNIFRNVSFDRFPDGVHLRGGQRGLIENVTVNIICEDAMTMNGGGYKVMDGIIRDCSFQYSEDKTIMVNNGIGAMVIRGCYFFNGNQPIRMTGGGILVVRHCEFEGTNNNGPRFGGNNNFVIFENNISHGTKSGLRLSDHVSAIVRRNVIQECTQFGVRIYKDNEDCLVRMENNTILDNNIGVFIERYARADLGGGLVDIHRHGLLSGPGATSVSSVGLNTITGSRSYDLMNNTSDTVKAENNIWDHRTVTEVMTNDVRGNADVDPLHPVSSVQEGLWDESTDEFVLLETYPNPFNDSVTIRYYLPEPGHVVIEVFDGLGKSVRKLVDGEGINGFMKTSWDGCDGNGHSLSSGLYTIRMLVESGGRTTSQYSKTKKALYIK